MVVAKQFPRLLRDHGLDDLDKLSGTRAGARGTGHSAACSSAWWRRPPGEDIHQAVRRARVPGAVRPASDLRLPPRAPLRARRRRHPGHDRLRAGRVDDRPCSAATPTGAAPLVPGQLPGQSGPWSATTASSGTRSRSSTRPARGKRLTLGEVAQDLRHRLISIFLVGADGRRPCFGGTERFQTDPAWKDNLFFNEYFHGDNGAGLGATHQTGWTGVVADIIRRRHGDVGSVGTC